MRALCPSCRRLNFVWQRPDEGPSALLGANEVRIKKLEGVEVLASLPAEQGGHPLLVTGSYGKGRTLAWMSDLSPHWLPAGIYEWPGYTILWRNIVGWLSKN